MVDDFGQYYEATEPGRRERAYAWATAIGLQDVDGLKPSKYLRSKGYDVTNDLFAEKSYYFRNALVRANYENTKFGIEKTQLPLEEFFKVLIYGCNLELRNRYLRVGSEYGTALAEATKNLHRANVGTNVGVKSTNLSAALNASEKEAVKVILRDPRVSAARLAGILGIGKRQSERIMAALKVKAGLKRRGATKNGEWYFEGTK